MPRSAALEPVFPPCGDGVLNPGEQCDDSNVIDGDGCDSNCTLTDCLNGIVTAGEQCDDGNTVTGDGCDTQCLVECPTAFVQSKVVIGHLNTPPGDDTLTLQATITLPSPLTPVLDPIANGVRLLLDDVAGSVQDITLAPGTFSKTSGRGWTVNKSATTWKYADKGAAPLGGITKVTIQAKSKGNVATVKIAFAVPSDALPLQAVVVLSSAGGQCGSTAFSSAVPAPSCSFNKAGKTLTCK